MTNNVFITGGSRGIGAAAVLAFARAGYNVAFTYNSHPDAADNVRRQAEEINPGGFYLAIRADAGDPAQVRAAVARAEQELGSLQVLVCNAGIAQVKLFTDTTDEDWRRMMAVDLDGAFYACRAVLPGMRARRSGHVFNVSSLGAYNVGPLSGVYCATKRAVKVISETLAQELVVGTPVYFAGANGALLALLDRAFYAASVHGRRFAGKPACAVTTLWRAGSTSTLDELNRCFTFSGMPVASSTYWNMMFNSGDDPFGEDMLRQLGENMAHLVRTTRV